LIPQQRHDDVLDLLYVFQRTENRKDGSTFNRRNHQTGLPWWLIRFFRQHAGTERLAALDRIAVHTRFRCAAFRTLEYPGIAPVSGRLAIAPRMDSHTNNCSAREAFQRNSLFECFAGTFHLDDPDEGLAFLIAHQSVTFVVQGDEVKFEMGGVGNDANDHTGKDTIDASVI